MSRNAIINTAISGFLVILILAVIAGIYYYATSITQTPISLQKRVTPCNEKERIVVDGRLYDRPVALNQPSEFEKLVEELNVFGEKKLSLIGGTYAQYQSADCLHVTFTDVRQPHDLIMSAKDQRVVSSMTSSIDEGGSLNITIGIDATYTDNPDRLLLFSTKSLLQALYMVTHGPEMSANGFTGRDQFVSDKIDIEGNKEQDKWLLRYQL